jgi:fluoroacetyl-CoA thioesterase
MKNPFQIGDTQTYAVRVDEAKLASFEAGLVHPVYSTFALGQDAEWAGRLFVLEMLEDGEEGIGSSLTIEHVAPAPLGALVVLTATLVEVSGNRVDTRYEAHHGERLVARGTQSQRIIQRTRMEALIASLQADMAEGKLP